MRRNLRVCESAIEGGEKNAAFEGKGDIFEKLHSAMPIPVPVPSVMSPRRMDEAKFVLCVRSEPITPRRRPCFHSRRIPSSSPPPPSTNPPSSDDGRHKAETNVSLLPLLCSAPLPPFLFLFILQSLFIVAERNKRMCILLPEPPTLSTTIMAFVGFFA